MATATKQFETFLKKGADAQRAVDAAIAAQERAETPAAFFMIAVAQIAPSPSNPRKHFAQADLEELAASIREQGIQQPILVRKAAAPAAVHEVMDDLLREKKSAAKYEIVTGERRWRAAQLAKLESVPCIVRELDDRAVLEAQIAENLQRKDISPLEEGHAYRAWLAAEGERRKANGGERVTVDDLAARIGKSRRYVYDKLQLLDLGEAATKALEKGEITAAHASELVRLKPEVQKRAMEAIWSGEVDGTRSLRTWIACERVKEEPEEDPRVVRPEKDPRKALAVRAATRTSTTHEFSLAKSTQLEAWNRISSVGAIFTGKLRGILYEYGVEKLRIAGADQMSLGCGKFWAVTGSVSSGNFGVFELRLTRIVRRSEWKGRTWAYNLKPRGKGGRLSYSGIRANFAGREWVLSGEDRTLRGENYSAAMREFPREEKRATWTPAAIRREMRGAIEERFGSEFRVERIARARKAGQWLAVIRAVQAPAPEAKTKGAKR